MIHSCVRASRERRRALAGTPPRGDNKQQMLEQSSRDALPRRMNLEGHV
jgi:hypothetical protein